MAKLFDFPVEEREKLGRGYVIVYCPDCGLDVAHYFVPNSVDEDAEFECPECGEFCDIIHLQEEEIQEVARVMDEGLCELCAYRQSMMREELELCEGCDGFCNFSQTSKTHN
jgi:predicted RNA-binding Zn-ribbon protein involved in translation (DUF1610 family)